MTVSVAADTADLADFVARGHRYVTALDALGVELSVAHGRTELLGLRSISPGLGAGPDPLPARSGLDLLIETAMATNHFVDAILVDLATAEPSPIDPRHSTASGADQPLSDDERDRMVDAITAGATPNDHGLTPDQVPPAYLALLRVDDAIATLEAERDDADGRLLIPFDGDAARVERIDAQLRVLQGRRAQVVDILGVDGSGPVSDVAAIAIVGRWTDGSGWAGRRYAQMVEATRRGLTTNGGRLALAGTEQPPDLAVLGDVADHVTIDPDVAVAFYNGLGAEGTAALATLIGGRFPHGQGDGEASSVLASFGRGLGAASRARTPDGSPRLRIAAAAIIRAPRVEVEPGTDASHPAALLIDGHFDPDFLAEATAATLDMAEREPGPGTAVLARPINPARDHLHHGADPRDIVLARSAEDPEAAAMVIERLAAGPRGLDPVLYPTIPFAAESTAVTSFLVAAGADDRAANQILAAAAEPGRRLGGPEVVGGIDGVMAIHANLLYPDHILDAVGIDRTAINTGADRPIGPDRWRAAHTKVLEAGHGSALAVGTELLLDRAIVAATGDGTFDHAAVRPFATIAALVESEADEARRNAATRADDHARRRYHTISRTVGTGLSALGLLPPLSLASAAGSASFALLLDGPSTDHERDVLRDQYQDLLYAGQARGQTWAHLVNHQLLQQAADGGGIEVTLPGSGRLITVAIRAADGGHRWLNPDSGHWEAVPLAASVDHRQLFDGTDTLAAIRMTDTIEDAYLAGVYAAADDPEAVIDRRRAAGQPEPEVAVDAAIELVEALGLSAWVADG